MIDSTVVHKSVVRVSCVCGREFAGPAGFSAHKRTCEKFQTQTRERAMAAMPTSDRPMEHREIASELREAIEVNAKAQERLREADAVLLRAREFATRAAVDLECRRAAAAAIGLQGDDAASVESIRAWIRGGPKS